MRNQTALKVMTYKLNENVIRSRTEPKKLCCRMGPGVPDKYTHRGGGVRPR